MANLENWISAVRRIGYDAENAAAKVCQDIILKAIAASGFDRNITVKGGVVMRSITGSVRRATQDMDLDFIRYSLEENSIRRFIDRLNCLDGITIQIAAPIEELSQQEYRGKRIYILIKDDTGHTLRSKIDLGVHKQMQIGQDEYCFDVCMDGNGVNLLVNSKEQIFTEKLRALLRFGPLSTRYKDIYDLCYLSGNVDQDRLIQCLNTWILSDSGMKENTVIDIQKRIHQTFQNRIFLQRLEHAVYANWLNINPSDACNRIETFLAEIGLLDKSPE